MRQHCTKPSLKEDAWIKPVTSSGAHNFGQSPVKEENIHRTKTNIFYGCI